VRPRLVCRAARYSPFGVWMRKTSCNARPCFSAKLTAARVGAPTESYATDFGGPVTSVTASSCFGSNPRTCATRRRGVANDSTVVPSARFSAASNFSRLNRNSSSARGSIPAGISSAPISNSRSTRFATTPFAEDIFAALRGFMREPPADRAAAPGRQSVRGRPPPCGKLPCEPEPSTRRAPSSI
jgi:hypothetical protein